LHSRPIRDGPRGPVRRGPVSLGPAHWRAGDARHARTTPPPTPNCFISPDTVSATPATEACCSPPSESDIEGAGILGDYRWRSKTGAVACWPCSQLAPRALWEARGPVNPQSLVRGLLWAGVARVVASRWNMDTETGVPFMDRFYTSLLSGDDVATALRDAARRVREDPATSHPYFWAGFQSFGTR